MAGIEYNSSGGGSGEDLVVLTEVEQNQTDGDQKTQIVDAGGTVADVTASNALKVDGSASTQPVGGTYNSSPPALSNGQASVIQLDSVGNLRTTEQYMPGYEDNTVGVAKTEQRFGYANIATATTLVVKSGAGFLHAVVINTKGTVASTVTVYDNTAASGNKIATIDSLNHAGTYRFDVVFSTGLTIVTTGTAAPDVSVSYR